MISSNDKMPEQPFGKHYGAALERLRNVIANRELPDDVRKLVIAAREVLDADGEGSLNELDKALEAFSDRVPYDDEPDDKWRTSLPVAEWRRLYATLPEPVELRYVDDTTGAIRKVSITDRPKTDTSLKPKTDARTEWKAPQPAPQDGIISWLERVVKSMEDYVNGR